VVTTGQLHRQGGHANDDLCAQRPGRAHPRCRRHLPGPGGDLVRLGRPPAFTPQKAIRRIADHLLDHLAQIETLLAGAEPIPDSWHGRTVTLASDWAPFTEADLNEARNRLGRLGQVYALRLRSLDEEALDAPRGQAWTIRQIVEHVAGVTWYAEQVGRLRAPRAEVGQGSP
jgi:hypothetical protein